MSRDQARSAVVSVSTPGVLPTGIPRRAHAANTSSIPLMVCSGIRPGAVMTSIASAGTGAIVAASDEMAIGVRESARRLGVRVPEDLSIIGIDDYVLSAVLGLTAVRQDVAGLGHAAAGLLLKAPLEDDRSTEEIVLPTELVVRESTGRVPAAAQPQLS